MSQSLDVSVGLSLTQGSLGQLQAAEEMIGCPVDDWMTAPRALVVKALLVVYGDMSEAEAEAMPLQEAIERANELARGTASP